MLIQEKSSAYLMVEIDPSVFPPLVTDVRMTSTDRLTFFGGRVWSKVMEVTVNGSYGEAQSALLTMLKANDMGWVLKWVENTVPWTRARPRDYPERVDVARKFLSLPFEEQEKHLPHPTAYNCSTCGSFVAPDSECKECS